MHYGNTDNIDDKTVAARMEIGFDIAYLAFAFLAGGYYLYHAQGDSVLTLLGLLSLVLGGGDAFHLAPRIYGKCKGRMDTLRKPLGIGKMVTSITMTVYYILLYAVWMLVYPGLVENYITGAVCLMATLRILLCLCPQNGWIREKSSYRWGIYRNIPFVIEGLLVANGFRKSALLNTDLFSYMWVAILISFLCYLPVVLLSEKKPMVGMLMIPKTCAYIWMIGMGFALVS